ncbi:lysylphosphatidylglycerol synthase transmembrane domain-containing protein [Natronomonas sp. LN261]|uniref:lysylphosphatidylglycerol synthase transmembrane domain-containing protein n=1 Tax=Natronomonas sp. LN261 TaxID=2750669 RepID=UPI0015EFD730|nr:lysylphosphatidylglycerol synthase transmembrane domain-containing protein [Natronomonas sp. LN261]
MRNNLKPVLSVAAAISAFGAIFLFVDLSAVLDVMGDSDRRYVYLLFVSMSVAIGMRGYVYVRLLNLVGYNGGMFRGLWLFLIYSVFRYTLPYAMAGTQTVMAYLSSRDDRIEIEHAFGAVLVADILVYVPHFTLGGVGILVYSGNVPNGTLLSAGIPVAALVAVLGVGYYQRWVVYRVFERVSAVVNAVRSRIGRPSNVKEKSRVSAFYDSIDRISSSRRATASGLVFGHLGMLFLMIPLTIAGHAVGVRIPIALSAGIVMITKFSGVLPTPGGVGGIEAIMVAMLVTIGDIGSATATAVTLLYRLSTYWYLILLGGIATTPLLRERLRTDRRV